jgi:Bacterial protein of unknown function (DUF899)
MPTHKVVKHDEGLKARKKHLAKEKEFTRLLDQLSRERRDLLCPEPPPSQGVNLAPTRANVAIRRVHSSATLFPPVVLTLKRWRARAG